METVPIDTLLDIFDKLSYEDIQEFCLSSRNFNYICRTTRVQNFIHQRYIEPYIKRFSTPERAFVSAAREGKILIVDYLIKSGVNPSYNNNQAIDMAIYNKNYNIVKYLLNVTHIPPEQRINLLIRVTQPDIIDTLMQIPKFTRDIFPNAIFMSIERGHHNLFLSIYKNFPNLPVFYTISTPNGPKQTNILELSIEDKKYLPEEVISALIDLVPFTEETKNSYFYLLENAITYSKSNILEKLLKIPEIYERVSKIFKNEPVKSLLRLKDNMIERNKVIMRLRELFNS